jgi:hypothetical protein
VAAAREEEIATNTDHSIRNSGDAATPSASHRHNFGGPELTASHFAAIKRWVNATHSQSTIQPAAAADPPAGIERLGAVVSATGSRKEIPP